MIHDAHKRYFHQRSPIFFSCDTRFSTVILSGLSSQLECPLVYFSCEQTLVSFWENQEVISHSVVFDVIIRRKRILEIR